MTRDAISPAEGEQYTTEVFRIYADAENPHLAAGMLIGATFTLTTEGGKPE